MFYYIYYVCICQYSGFWWNVVVVLIYINISLKEDWISGCN